MAWTHTLTKRPCNAQNNTLSSPEFVILTGFVYAEAENARLTARIAELDRTLADPSTANASDRHRPTKDLSLAKIPEYLNPTPTT